MSSRPHRPVLLFLHSPKTAGITVTEQVLRPQYSAVPYEETADGWIQSGMLFYPGDQGFFKPRRGPLDPGFVDALQAPELSAVVGHFSFGVHELLPDRQWTYFTFLRDPIDRVWSLYRHIRAWVDDGLPLGDAGLEYHPGVDLPTLFDRYALRELDNDQVRRIAGEEPEYACCTRELLELATHRLDEDIALAGTLDRFDDSLRLAAQTFEWRRPLSPRHRTTNRGLFADAPIDPETRDLIAHHNRLDHELYQHARRLLEERLRAAQIGTP